MARQRFDKSSKWMLQHHGDALLALGGAGGIRRWKAVQPEQVQVGQLPDGLLQVYFLDQKKPDYFLVEVATFPEERVHAQAVRGAMLVYLDRKVLLEVLTVVLRPRGRAKVTGKVREQSRLGWTELGFKWKVLDLWNVSAEQLLAANEVGLIPWLPLTRFDGTPEAILKECRRRIEEQARHDQQEGLLAVAQVMTTLRYNDPGLLTILGGTKVMRESPLILNIVAEERRRDIVLFLEERFGALPTDLVGALQSVKRPKQLDALTKYAATCPDLEAFRSRLFS